MVEFRWVGEELQFRERGFQVDAAGAFCGVTEFGQWQTVPRVDVACTCPKLDGITVVGSACPIHGFETCEI